MKLGVWLIVIILVPTALSLGAARLFGIRQSTWVFLIGAFLLPAICFVAGMALLIYFLAYTYSLSPGSQNGGDGPAFFVIIGIAFLLPVLLSGPGLLSGFLASFLFQRKVQKEDEQIGSER